MKKILLSSLLCGWTFLSLSVAQASVLIDGTPKDVEGLLQRFEKISLYLQTPSGERFHVTSDDIVRTMSTDTSTEGSAPLTRVSINTQELLQRMAEENKVTSIVPSASVVRLEETATGARIPESTVGMGYAVEHEMLEELLLRQLLSEKPKAAAIQIPATSLEPSVLLKKLDGTEEKLGIVSHGISDFRGSTKARIHNIETGMAHFQGVKIEGGAEFSFNDILGPVDGSTGYLMELVIKGDKTLPDYGGGVCQVSSTLFRSALLAGFPILERKPHSYAVSYYTPWGTDATIYPGVTDLKFKNNLSTPVYIHYFMEGTKLNTMLYGTPDGRQVTLGASNTYAFVGAPDPKVEYVTTLAPGKRVWKEYGHNGFSAWVERRIVSSTGDVMTEKILSTYEPRPGFVLEGKGAEVPLPVQ